MGRRVRVRVADALRRAHGAAQERHGSTGGLWFRGALADKVATGFTSASTGHGGLESTILALNNVFYHWGSIVLPVGYTAPIFNEHGNPYGASWVSRKSAPPDDQALEAARQQGRRLADVTGALVRGRG